MTRFSPEVASVIETRNVGNEYRAIILGPLSRIKQCRPGHFIHLRLPDSPLLFRRAMSIASVDSGRREMEIIFKVVGRGTKLLAACRKGDSVDVLGPLGVPFKLPKKNETVLMVGGGIGFPPLFFLAADMVRRGYDPAAIEFFYGGRRATDILERTRIKKLGVRFRPVTEDGSLGQKGLVTEAVEQYRADNPGKRLRIYSCGPEAMLRAVDDLGRKYGVPGQLSLEAPMPCGIGVCLGCVVELRKGGHARVCSEGPVFDIGEVVL